MKAAAKPIRPMNPRTADVKYTGVEPTWPAQPTDDQRQGALIGAFTWYNYHYGKKDVKEIVIDWLARNDRTTEARGFARVPESVLRTQMGWLCRMNLMGLELNQREKQFINDTISGHLAATDSIRQLDTVVDAAPRITIQDRLRDKAHEIAGELEGMFDDMIQAGAKMSADYKPMAVMRGMNISPQMISVVSNSWQHRLSELEAVQAGRDAQLVEGYGNFSKTQLRNLIKFCEQVLADCASYVQIKKTERAPRKKKPVSPERLTQRFRYLREFSELKLKSEPVTKLVGATEAWLYDTKKRKLIHVMADSHIGCITVKGTAILGFDPANTLQKTLRRPEEQIKAIMAGGAPAARKYFKDIRATEIKYNGRSNENLILLRIR
jgi:hypothetical protein